MMSNTTWIFPLYFQLHYLHKQQVGSSVVEVPTSVSLFLKSEKIPTLLDVGNGPYYRPFSYAKDN
jgi:hypothetical protein